MISHDRSFLDEFGPTHVLSVRDGTVSLEERELREDDWNDILGSREASKFASNSNTENTKIKGNSKDKQSNAEMKSEMKSQKKNNGSKQRAKLENSINKLESQISKIDEDLITNSRDRSKVTELSSKRKQLEKELEELYANYE